MWSYMRHEKSSLTVIWSKGRIYSLFNSTVLLLSPTYFLPIFSSSCLFIPSPANLPSFTSRSFILIFEDKQLTKVTRCFSQWQKIIKKANLSEHSRDRWRKNVLMVKETNDQGVLNRREWWWNWKRWWPLGEMRLKVPVSLPHCDVDYIFCEFILIGTCCWLPTVSANQCVSNFEAKRNISRWVCQSFQHIYLNW